MCSNMLMYIFVDNTECIISHLLTHEYVSHNQLISKADKDSLGRFSRRALRKDHLFEHPVIVGIATPAYGAAGDQLKAGSKRTPQAAKWLGQDLGHTAATPSETGYE
jgi:hypothetical protein